MKTPTTDMTIQKFIYLIFTAWLLGMAAAIYSADPQPQAKPQSNINEAIYQFTDSYSNSYLSTQSQEEN